MRRALFLDRDGVINALVYYRSSDEWEAPRTVAELRILPGVVEAMKRAQAAGWLLGVITNQPSAAKGKIARASLEEVHATLLEELRASGVRIEWSSICLHHPQGTVPELTMTCACRKPSPEPLIQAAASLDLDLANSWMVGDQDTDLRCGRSAGCRVAVVENPASASKRFGFEADLKCENLPDFVDRLLAMPDGEPEGTRA